MCLRIDAGRPIAYVSAEAGISRRCRAKWYARWRAHGENGLLDHSSRPATSPARTPSDTADLVEALRRQTKHGPARLAADLQRLHGITVAPATVHRILVRRGLNRLRDLDPPIGEQLREVIRYEHDRVGDLVHVDVKKLGRIPTGGGWRMHGVGTDAARASKRSGPGTGKVDTRTCILRSTTTPGSPTPRPWTMRRPSPRSPSGTGPLPSSPPTASHRSAAASPTTARATGLRPGLTRSPRPVRSTSGPGRTRRARTGRWRGISAPRGTLSYPRCSRGARARRKGDRAEVRLLYRQLHRLPSQDPNDPDYRRLRYVRYADDTLLGFVGPKAEAEGIKQRLATFLRDDLKLELPGEDADHPRPDRQGAIPRLRDLNRENGPQNTPTVRIGPAQPPLRERDDRPARSRRRDQSQVRPLWHGENPLARTRS